MQLHFKDWVSPGTIYMLLQMGLLWGVRVPTDIDVINRKLHKAGLHPVPFSWMSTRLWWRKVKQREERKGNWAWKKRGVRKESCTIRLFLQDKAFCNNIKALFQAVFYLFILGWYFWKTNSEQFYCLNYLHEYTNLNSGCILNYYFASVWWHLLSDSTFASIWLIHFS